MFNFNSVTVNSNLILSASAAGIRIGIRIRHKRSYLFKARFRLSPASAVRRSSLVPAVFTATGILFPPAISLEILLPLSSWLDHTLVSTATGTGIAALAGRLSTAPVHRTQNQ